MIEVNGEWYHYDFHGWQGSRWDYSKEEVTIRVEPYPPRSSFLGAIPGTFPEGTPVVVIEIGTVGTQGRLRIPLADLFASVLVTAERDELEARS